MTSSLSNKFVIPPNILAQEIKGEVVLVNMDTEAYYSLNKVGSRMWQVLKQQGDVETATQQLLQIFAVDEASLRRDLTALLDELVEERLLNVVPTQESA